MKLENPSEEKASVPEVDCCELLSIEVKYRWTPQKDTDFSCVWVKQLHIPRLGEQVAVTETRIKGASEIFRTGKVENVLWIVKDGKQAVEIYLR